MCLQPLYLCPLVDLSPSLTSGMLPHPTLAVCGKGKRTTVSRERICAQLHTCTNAMKRRSATWRVACGHEVSGSGLQSQKHRQLSAAAPSSRLETGLSHFLKLQSHISQEGVHRPRHLYFKCRFPGATSDTLYQNIWGWNREIFTVERQLSGSSHAA